MVTLAKVEARLAVANTDTVPRQFTVKTERDFRNQDEYVIYNGTKRLTPYRFYDVAVREANKLERQYRQMHHLD